MTDSKATTDYTDCTDFFGCGARHAKCFLWQSLIGVIREIRGS